MNPTKTHRLRRTLLLILALIACALLLQLRPWQRHAGEAHEHPHLAGLVDHTGRRFYPDTFAGQYKLVYFGFTRCSDPCQTAMASLALALQDLGELSNRVQAIYVTTDPERDTPERLNWYLAKYAIPIVGLTGTKDAVTLVANDFGVDLVPSRSIHPAEGRSSSDYFLLTPDGMLLLKLSGTSSPEALANQLRALLDVIAT